VAERHLAMLREVGQIALAVTRAFGDSASASAETAKGILADQFFIPEVGRANACGAKDAAESFQKVTRALRLTMMLERTTVEWLRDIRAGIVAPAPRAKDAGETSAVQSDLQERRRDGGSCSDEGDHAFGRRERDAERLVDIERPDVLPRAPFNHSVDRICDDLGAAIDWKAWKVRPPEHAPRCTETPVETTPAKSVPGPQGP
jgi:hypothetical protein